MEVLRHLQPGRLRRASCNQARQRWRKDTQMQNRLQRFVVLASLCFLPVAANAETASEMLTSQITNLKKEVEDSKASIGALQKEIADLRSALQSSSGQAAGDVSSGTNAATHDQYHTKYPPAYCPSGQYVAGLKTWSDTAGGGIGDLTGVQVYCRPVLL
jgi:hypothetical protein